MKTIKVVGGTNLYKIAAEELGDALQWNRIAQLNGLVDPWITAEAPIDLKIPDRNPNASTDGIFSAS